MRMLCVPTHLGPSLVSVTMDTREMDSPAQVCSLLHKLTCSGAHSELCVCVFSFIHSDVNECLTTPCDANAVCTNTLGSFMCACNRGFIGDGLTCTGGYNYIYCVTIISLFS